MNGEPIDDELNSIQDMANQSTTSWLRYRTNLRKMQ